jgi:hypothetical protein
MQAPAGAWVTPAFCLHVSKLDEIRPMTAVSAQPRQKRATVRHACRTAWFTHLIFDCDGVLVDSERASCEALRRAVLQVTGAILCAAPARAWTGLLWARHIPATGPGGPLVKANMSSKQSYWLPAHLQAARYQESFRKIMRLSLACPSGLVWSTTTAMWATWRWTSTP